MTTRMRWRSGSIVLATALCGASAFGQFPQLVSDFDDPGWTPFVTVVMFRNPTVSGSTRGLDPLDGDLTYLTDVTSDTFSRAHSGTRSSATFFGWLTPSNPSSWVRVVTLNPGELPNPALHLAGKVRFWAAATAYTSSSFATPVTNGHLFLALGVRETGQGVRQGGNGGISGDIEWVGLERVLLQIYGGPDNTCNTTVAAGSDDLQLVPSGGPAGPGVVCIDAGPDRIMQTVPGGDDVLLSTPKGTISIPSDGVMREYVFDLPALQASGNVFGLSGDGMLQAAPNNRGVLEHLVLTNDPTNAAVNAKVFLFNIDDVQFEAPIIDPPSIPTEPAPRPLDEQVHVDFVSPAASQVAVYRLNSQGNELLIGSLNPAGAASVDVPTTPLPAGVRVYARQTIGANTSDNSTPVVVSAPGNGPLRIAMGVRETDAYDHDLACGADGTGFDPTQPSILDFIGAADGNQGFGVPIPPRFPTNPNWFEVVMNPCDPVYGVAVFSGADDVLELNPAPNHTNGVWEGLYFRIDEISPTVGPYTVYIDDLTVRTASGTTICVVDDFEGYTPGEFIVGDFAGNGVADTFAEPSDVQVVPVGSPTFPGQIIVGPGVDGTLETIPAGDDGQQPLHARFNFPGVSGTSVGVAPSPNRAEVTDEDSFSGTRSLKIQFAFIDASNAQSVLRLTTNGSLATNPPETFVNPDSVIPFSVDGTFCDGAGDIVYSVRIKLAPPAVPADCDGDGDVDLHDFACMQRCFSQSPGGPPCSLFDIAPNGAPDGVINNADFGLFRFLMVGPQQ